MAFTRQQVAEIYVATFNRAPDAAGLDWWMNESGFTNIEDVASSFFDSDEASSMYPEGTTTTAKVEAAYQNLFGRDADPLGLSYWVSELDSGSFSQSLMLQAMINGAKNTEEFGNDATMMENKTIVGLDFANAGNADVDSAISIMKIISDDVSTITDAQKIITATPPSLLESDTTNLYRFTQEWLNGKTLYNVFDENSNQDFTNLTEMSFSNGMASGVGFNGLESSLESYTVDENGVIVMMDTDGITYISGLSENTDLNAIELVWSDQYEDVITASKSEALSDNDFEYFFLSKESANLFINTFDIADEVFPEESNQIPEDDGGYIYIPEETEFTSIFKEGVYAGQYIGDESGEIAFSVYPNGKIDGAIYSYADDVSDNLYGDVSISNVINLYIDNITAVGSFIDLDTIQASWSSTEGSGSMTLELIGTNDISPYTYIDSF